MRDKASSASGKIEERDSLPSFNFCIPFWIFMTGSMAGFVIEGVWSIVKRGHWEHHAATIWGPFCIIYGVGAISVYAMSYILRKQNAVTQFAAYLLAGSLVEYFFSLFQELWFGSVSWNYSTHFLNIGGRVSLQMTLAWGALGILFAKYLLPPMKALLVRIKGQAAHAVTWMILVFMVVNLTATCLTVTRWRARQTGTAPASDVEQIIDSVYDDAKMEKLFPNMCFIEK